MINATPKIKIQNLHKSFGEKSIFEIVKTETSFKTKKSSETLDHGFPSLIFLLEFDCRYRFWSDFVTYT